MAAPFALLALLAAVQPASGPDADALVREVIRNHVRIERTLPPHTYDLTAIDITYGRDGSEKATRKVYAVTSGGAGSEQVRELLQVNGRPATEEEKREAAAEDAKSRRKNAAAARDENDPTIGPRRLSEVLALYDYRLEDREVVDGRLCYVLTFRPRPGAQARTVRDRALASLEGRVVVDAADLQVRGATAHLVTPVRVAGGLAANVKTGDVSFEAQRMSGGIWVPCRVAIRLKGTTALFFRLDKGLRYRMDHFRRFDVATESGIGARRAAAR